MLDRLAVTCEVCWRYGVKDHLDDGTARPDYPGAGCIRRLLLVGTLNLVTIQPILSLTRGVGIGLRKIPTEIVATTTGAQPNAAQTPCVHLRETPDTHGKVVFPE